MINVGPDEPFGGGIAGAISALRSATTGQVMKFRVVKRTGKDASLPPAQLKKLPALAGRQTHGDPPGVS